MLNEKSLESERSFAYQLPLSQLLLSSTPPYPILFLFYALRFSCILYFLWDSFADPFAQLC